MAAHTPSSSSSPIGTILSPEERSNLQQKLRERQRELEERQKRGTFDLSSSKFATDGEREKREAPSISENTDAKALLNDILQKLNDTPVSAESKGTAAPESRFEVPPHPVGEADTAISFKIQKKPTAESVIIPKSITTFEKSVQVDEFSFLDDKAPQDVNVALKEPTEFPRRSKSGVISVEEIKEGTLLKTSVAQHPQEVQEMITVIAPPEPPAALTDEERQTILHSVKFTEFFDRSSRLIERALGASEMSDIMVDFSGSAEADVTDFEEYKLTAFQSYVDNKWSPKRPITDIRVSSTYAELFLTAYGPSENTSSLDPDGCVLVWNAAMPQRPEYVFTYQSGICSALFNKFQRSLIIGGTASGSIVVWDMRAKSKPVQRTPLTTKGHTHPVFSAELVGTQNAHNLVTVDTDGKLCQWSLSMLVNPSETVALRRRSKEVSCGCISFPEDETNTLMGGLEDGSLFEAHIHGSKVGITESYESHDGAVTGMQFHPQGEGNIDFSDLLLTSSVDWTVKLWNPKSHAKPLYTFDTLEDYVYDVKWHPIHPAAFVCADAEGCISMWNLAHDWEVEAFHTSAESAVNKICWTVDGKRLVTGERNGKVTLWNATLEPRLEDWEKFEAKVIERKHELSGSIKYHSYESTGGIAVEALY